jgi:hypothetical protein
MKNESPFFIYSMIPVEKTMFTSFFETGPLKSFLENPGQLRYAGWDLTTGGQARIIKGHYLELKSAERKRLQVYEDGSLFVKVSADQDYLSWGVNDETFRRAPRLNTLALIEFSFNFCLLCAGLIKYLEPEPSQVDLNLEIRNAFLGESKLSLIPRPVSRFGFGYDDRYPAPEPSMKRRVRVPTEQIKARPDVAAFSLVREIFIWFGITPDTIPYASVEDGVRFIDRDKIENSRFQ